ncbi:hypothetical protein BC831DRAFT_376173, partial [Entophlyctis helioformis]
LSPSQRKLIREMSRGLSCFNCGTTKTPVWRRAPDRINNLCNACGLFVKHYGHARPVSYNEKARRSQTALPPA